MQWRVTYGLIKEKVTTYWMVQGLNPSGDKIFCTHPDWAWGPPSLLYNKYQVFFPQVKHPEHGINHPPPSRTEVKESVQLHLYSSSGPSWPGLVWMYLLQEKFSDWYYEIRYMLSLLLFMTWKLQDLDFCCRVCTTCMSINNVWQYLLA